MNSSPGYGKGDGIVGIIELSIFPNPTSGDATMVFQLPAGQTYAVRIFDTSGRLIYLDENMAIAGENTVSLQLNGYAPGVYLIDIQSDKWKAHKRLMIQE